MLPQYTSWIIPILNHFSLIHWARIGWLLSRFLEQGALLQWEDAGTMYRPLDYKRVCACVGVVYACKYMRHFVVHRIMCTLFFDSLFFIHCHFDVTPSVKKLLLCLLFWKVKNQRHSCCCKVYMVNTKLRSNVHGLIPFWCFSYMPLLSQIAQS